jgi:hypothetical protein
MLFTGFTLPVFGLKETYGSPKFPGNPSVSLPCSQTPTEPPRLAFTALWCCPRRQNNEGLDDSISFEAQSHGFDTGCLRFMPPSLATTQNSLPVVANLFRVGFQFTH